ncbi:MAG: tetratricopeptide repeat protein, partial [Proteobacteria bacterium]|nr:tetratricopeptide repeat protein [Pseudomonadota bacterium]
MTGPNPDASYEHRQRAAAMALQAGRARTAEQALRALSAEAPADPRNCWLLGIALLDQGKLADAIASLEGVLQGAADFAHARVDLARAYRAAGRVADARAQLRVVLGQHPRLALAWLAYGDVLVDLQQYEDARIAFERARQCDPERASIEAATQVLLADDRKAAEALFRQVLQRDPGHAAALCGLATLSLAADVPADAERLLRHALRQSPHLPLAWRGLGPAMLSLGRLSEAEAAARYLRTIEPENPQSWIATAAAAARLLQPEVALAAYQRAAELQPQEVRLHTSIGHVQKTLGRRAESEAAYKAAIALDRRNAEAYWSLADLKNYAFSDAEIAAMQAVLVDPQRPPAGDAQLCFALGKAFEQRRQYARAFEYYARGNARRRLDAPFDIAAFEQRAARIRAVFNAEFVAAHAACGDASPAPIFIVG